MQTSDDIVLLSELKRGNQSAFTELYKQHYKRLFLEAKLLLAHRKDLIDDVVQDVFTSIWSKREQLPDEVCLRVYLNGCVRNRCIDLLRRMHRVVTEDVSRYADVEDPACIKVPLEQKEIGNDIKHAIADLPDAQRKVVQLFVVDGMRQQEIMEQTGKSIQNIKNLLLTAKKTLRQKLLPHHS